MNGYTVYLILCSLACARLYVYLLRGRLGRGRQALFCLMPVLTGYIGAKAGFLLFTLSARWARLGLLMLTETKPDTFSFMGGTLGVILGLYFCAHITGKKDSPDFFAAPGAFLTAALRLGEVRLGTLGAGAPLPEGSALTGTLLCVYNTWGEPFLAVCVLEAAWALAVGVYMALTRRREGALGRSLVLICSGQVFFEVLRSNTLTRAFVRADQVYSVLALLFISLYPLFSRTKKTTAALLPPFCVLLCAAVNGYMQYCLERPEALPGALSRLPDTRPLCLITVALTALLMGLAAYSAGAKRNSRG